MSPEIYFGKYVKAFVLLTLSLLTYISCEKGDPLNNGDFPLIPKEDTLKDYSPDNALEATFAVHNASE